MVADDAKTAALALLAPLFLNNTRLISNQKASSMPSALESKLDDIERELKEIKRKMYLPDSKKRFFRAAGSWSKLDTEKLKKRMHKSKNVHTRGRVEF